MDKKTFSFSATGTQWEVTIWNSPETSLQQKVEGLIADFEKVFSRFREDSLVTKLSGRIGAQHVDKDFTMLLKIYQKFYHATDGIVTPLMGTAMSDAGYDAQYSFEKKDHQQVPEFSMAVDIVDSTTIDIATPVSFDFGAMGKGYGIDLLSTFLRDQKVMRFLINAGGDLYYFDDNQKETSVALEDPRDVAQAIGKIEILNQSLCASGAHKRQWAEGQHHIIDPRTGKSTKDVIATWTLADTAMVADGLATSLFFVLPQKLLEAFDFDYVIMYANGSVQYSDFFREKLFIEDVVENK